MRVARRAEENLLAVGRPAHHAIGRRVPRQALGHAAGRRHGEDIDIAVVLAREGEHGAIGREERLGLEAGAGGQPRRGASLAAHAPQISGVREDDVGAVHRGLLHQVNGAESAGQTGTQKDGKQAEFHETSRRYSVTR